MGENGLNLQHFNTFIMHLMIGKTVEETRQHNFAVWCQYVANGGVWDFDKYIQMYAFTNDHITPHPELEPDIKQ